MTHPWTHSTKPKRKGLTPEGAVLKAIAAYLKLCRLGRVVRQQVGVARYGDHGQQRVPYGELGASDLRVDLDGSPRSIFIEVKRPGGHASEHQLAYLAQQRSRGHVAFVADSVEAVEAVLTSEGFRVPLSARRRAA
jgi:hypothetical protein